MPSFGESTFIFLLALMLLGPKKLPALARELGKWIGEFRRASNEFKMQMEEEMHAVEQAEKQKKVEALAESAPPPVEPLMEPVPEPTPSYDVAPHLADSGDGYPMEPEPPAESAEALPIASSGEITMNPPETGLPVSRDVAYPAELADATAQSETAASSEPAAHSEAANG